MADDNDSACFSLDGFTIPEDELLADYREASGQFYYDLPDGFADPEQGYVAWEGHWVMLEPLPPGEHMLYTCGGASSDNNFFVEKFLTITSRLPGDFNADDVLDVQDIDLLTAESASGDNDPAFDLYADLQVDQADISMWAKDLRQTWIGDADVDGEFNSADLVKVFTAGKYEAEATAVWSEGDWTGDGVFDSGDLVAAFTDAGYEQGPVVAAAVPEPNAWYAVGIALLTFTLPGVSKHLRRRAR